MSQKRESENKREHLIHTHAQKKRTEDRKKDLTLADRRYKNRKISRIRVHISGKNIIPTHGTEGLRTIKNIYIIIYIEGIYTNNN